MLQKWKNVDPKLEKFWPKNGNLQLKIGNQATN